MSVEDELKLAEGVANEIKKVINPLKYADDEWSTTVAAFIDQAFEHHTATILLIRSSLFGSAFALLRSIVEIVVRGVWSREEGIREKRPAPRVSHQDRPIARNRA